MLFNTFNRISFLRKEVALITCNSANPSSFGLGMAQGDHTSFIGYHTCELRNCGKTTLKNGPFKSSINRTIDDSSGRWQWLSTGYYFWTDSDHFAHKWGVKSVKGDYAIIKCALNLPSQQVLDLVGNVTHQQWFIEMSDMYERSVKEKYRSKQRPHAAVTVSTTIEHLRKKNLFPFVAVKAEDDYSESKMAFTPNTSEFMKLLKRQQLCVFESAIGCVVNKVLVHPELVV
jgi:hypothetical protein